MKLRNIFEGMKHYNDEELSRPLFESIVAPEVELALKDWLKATKNPGLLIGGLAVSFYGRPRATTDVDVLYLSDSEIPTSVDGFKKTRGHAFLHLKTHVDIEVLSPEFLKIPVDMVQAIRSRANNSNGIVIPDKSGLVMLKLYRLTGDYDEGDIKQLIRSGGIDLTPYKKWLKPELVDAYKRLEQSIQKV